METIYGIQADTETLREAHERQRRIQQRLQEQHLAVSDSTADAAPTKSGLAKLKSPPKPTMVARSTSASALPSPATLGIPSHSPSLNPSGAVTPTKPTAAAAARPRLIGSAATSPFIQSAEYHHQHSPGPSQLRSTTHSPAFLSKLYDVEHRLPNSVPWLPLPGTAGAAAAAAAAAATSGFSSRSESPVVFGRRKSDSGTPTSGASTPGLGYSKHSYGPVTAAAMSSSSLALEGSQQQENPFPQSPQLQPHPHPHPHAHHHLLSHQELAALSRTSSPMLNEALPLYLRRKSDSLHAMERSLSNPGGTGAVGMVHTAPGSPFVHPIHSPAAIVLSSGENSGVVTPMHTASPAHMMFAFPSQGVISTATSHSSSSNSRSIDGSNTM
ncbi:hypothetical protein BGZ99_000846 [Dissophora globulifera]|uniref:Uncharacterized protein n=1 Tax=Dissophora globulifera TaxID=979702 RepID=A0A9P6UYB4_9FUNG|nr:hypothetical protein BGZ99_000846 [Dissophora globulifera]